MMWRLPAAVHVPWNSRHPLSAEGVCAGGAVGPQPATRVSREAITTLLALRAMRRARGSMSRETIIKSISW
jgi:hypothetical protein